MDEQEPNIYNQGRNVRRNNIRNNEDNEDEEVGGGGDKMNKIKSKKEEYLYYIK